MCRGGTCHIHVGVFIIQSIYCCVLIIQGIHWPRVLITGCVLIIQEIYWLGVLYYSRNLFTAVSLLCKVYTGCVLVIQGIYWLGVPY